MPESLTTDAQEVDARVAVAALAASAVVLLTAPGSAAVGAAVTIVVLARVALVDARTHRIPNSHLGAAAAVLVTAAAVSGPSALRIAATTAAVWGGLLLAMHLVDGSLGFGDVKLGFAIGGMLGLVGHAGTLSLLIVLLVSSGAFVAGSLLTLLASRRSEGATPFSPGLVLAAVAAALAISVSGVIS